MKKIHNVKNVRRTTLAVAALALLPLGAGAMTTTHDTRAFTATSELGTDVQRSESLSAPLALRFGAYSGFGEQAVVTGTAGSISDQPGKLSKEPMHQLP